MDGLRAPGAGPPAADRATRALVTRVLFDGSGRAVGVEVSRDGVISQLRAGGDVIVSGGVIGSAQLMLLTASERPRPAGAGYPGAGGPAGGRREPARPHPDHGGVGVAAAGPRRSREQAQAQFFAVSDPAMAAPDLQPLISHVPLPVAGYHVPAEGSGYSVLPALSAR